MPRGCDGTFEAPARGGVEQRGEVAVETQHQHLRLGIAKAHVELDHPRRAGRIDHQSDEEHALEGMTLGRHAADRRMDDLLEHALLDRGAEDRRGRIRAHAAGVLAAIAILRALVILGPGERHHAATIRDGVVRDFLADQALFDDDARTGGAEATRTHDLRERALGFGCVVTDRDALAGRESVCFYDARPSELAHVGARGFELVEHSECCGRNRVATHEFLRERLAALELRGRARGTEDRKAGVAQPIADARDERIFGADDDEVDLFALRERDHRIGVTGFHGREATRLPRDRVAAGRREHAGDARTPRDLPGERMLASATAEDQHPHRVSSWWP